MLVQAVCKEAGIPVEECSINFRTRQVGLAVKAEGKDRVKEGER